MCELKVAVAVDENYVYPLKVMLHSLFSAQQGRVTVYFVHSQVGKEIIGELKCFCGSYHARLKEVLVEDALFGQIPLGMHITKETYYRLLLPWLLPDEDKVLYLDPDIIINASLDGLWNVDFGNAFLAAVRDRTIMVLGTPVRSQLHKDTVYVNAGVLVMNLKKIRTEIGREEIFSLINEKGKDFPFLDQDLMNVLWEGKIQYMDGSYNFNPNFLFLKEHLSMLWKTDLWKIIHYMGPDKPWNKGYKGNMYFPWAKAEWHIYPQKRWQIFGRVLLEPYRYMRGLFLFVKNHKWKKR